MNTEDLKDSPTMNHCTISILYFLRLKNMASEKRYRIQKAFYLFNVYLLSILCASEAGNKAVGKIPAFM